MCTQVYWVTTWIYTRYWLDMFRCTRSWLDMYINYKKNNVYTDCKTSTWILFTNIFMNTFYKRPIYTLHSNQSTICVIHKDISLHSKITNFYTFIMIPSAKTTKVIVPSPDMSLVWKHSSYYLHSNVLNWILNLNLTKEHNKFSKYTKAKKN